MKVSKPSTTVVHKEQESVGRTGAFCVIHSVIKKYKGKNSHEKIILQPFLSDMREQRPGLVQQKAQYTFCYQAVELALNGTLEASSTKKKTKKEKDKDKK